MKAACGREHDLTHDCLHNPADSWLLVCVCVGLCFLSPGRLSSWIQVQFWRETQGTVSEDRGPPSLLGVRGGHIDPRDPVLWWGGPAQPPFPCESG